MTGVSPSQDQGLDLRGFSEDPVVRDARKEFLYAQKWEMSARKLWLDDLKFAEADSDNGYQWPNDIRRNRDIDERPCLTVNVTRQHNLQIINDAKKNKPSVAVRATGGGASAKSAEAFSSIIKHIEYISRASTAYDTATEFQVKAGLGYLRVATDYADDQSFNQEIYIRRVPDPLCIFLDPDAKEVDKSDSRFGFIFDDVPKDVFDQKYPKYKDLGAQAALGADDDWITTEKVRVAEYFKVEEEDDHLFSIADENLGERVVLGSKLPAAMREELLADPSVRSRVLSRRKVMWYLIIGNKVAEKKEWPSKYIPIVPVIGEETVIDGRMDRKGHTRALKDPQRIYNYWTSSAVEFVALQGKSPWVASAEAIEEYESMWNTANTVNHSVLIYNGMNDAGEPIAPPQRPAPPQMAPAYLTGMQVAGQELMMVSGQYQAQMGEQGNERSGKAISERQRQGDNSTYHFIDNLATAIRQVGRILLDLIPKIYDTKRVIMILAEDGTESELTIDPSQKQAYVATALETAEAAKGIFNPSVGTYEVEADVGPGYATQREQAFDAYLQIITQNPGMTQILGDLLLGAADFPMAQEGAARLRRMVPPQALGQGPSPGEAEAQAQIQQITGLLQKTLQELAVARLKLKGKEQMRDIDAYNAETTRMKTLGDHALSAEDKRRLAVQLLSDTHQTQLDRVSNTAEASFDPGQGQASQGEAPPLPGARKAPDGQWYVADMQRPGKYARVRMGQGQGQGQGAPVNA